jgi:hypothetical protein
MSTTANRPCRVWLGNAGPFASHLPVRRPPSPTQLGVNHSQSIVESESDEGDEALAAVFQLMSRSFCMTAIPCSDRSYPPDGFAAAFGFVCTNPSPGGVDHSQQILVSKRDRHSQDEFS